MREHAPLQQIPETAHNTSTSMAFKALALAGTIIALAGSEKASAASTAPILPAKTIGNLYSPLTPDGVVPEMPGGVAPDQGTAQAVGARLVNSIPGESVDVSQPVTGLQVSQAAAVANFACPANPRLPQRYPAIQTVEVDQGNRASLTFCPSPKVVDISPVNVTDPKFSDAFGRFAENPVRNTPWGGDSPNFNKNMFMQCPNISFNYDNRLVLKYSPNRNAKVSFYGLSPMQYCDKMGQFTSEALLVIRKPGKRRYTQIGNSVLHISGLKESLVYGDPITVYTFGDEDVTARLPGTKVSCTPALRHAKVRLKLIERLRGMDGQQFQHAFNGDTHLVGKMKTLYSKPTTIC